MLALARKPPIPLGNPALTTANNVSQPLTGVSCFAGVVVGQHASAGESIPRAAAGATEQENEHDHSSAQRSRHQGAATAKGIDMKFEIVVIPVSDVDRAKRFYGEPRDGGSTPNSPPVTTSA